MKTSPHGGRSQRGQFRLQGVANRGGEPLWCLHHDVDHEGAAAEAQLRALPIKIGDRLLHLTRCAVPHLAAVVQYAVNGSFTHSGLYGDLVDPVRMSHELLLAGFWRLHGVYAAVFPLRMTSIDRDRTIWRNPSWL